MPPPAAGPSASSRRVTLVTLGCGRNEVDSDELAGRLADDGWHISSDADPTDVVLVNTCGFVAAAKKDSVDTLLAAAEVRDAGNAKAVVAVGCFAERYGAELADEMPEVDAVLSFDDYSDISARLHSLLDGERRPPHRPVDRRQLLPIAPVDRPAASGRTAIPGHGHRLAPPAPPPLLAPPDLPAGIVPASGPRPIRRRLTGGPTAPLKLASGCDRRCSFCAIPSFRGSYISRAPDDVVQEARWLAAQGVRELLLVSENSTSYGKDLGDLRALESLLPRLGQVPGVCRVRVTYLQPAEVRPGLLDVLTGASSVVPYFDLSFQHASAPVLRRMRRFGSRERFLDLIGEIRARAPLAGIRSNVIVGFPGETDADLAELEAFLTAARLDAIGVFGYSDEDGTEAATYDRKVPDDVIAVRVNRVAALADELLAQRAEDRQGELVEVLVESVRESPDDSDDDVGRTGSEPYAVGRADHQAPDVDGVTMLVGSGVDRLRVGHLVLGQVTANAGVDLEALLVKIV